MRPVLKIGVIFLVYFALVAALVVPAPVLYDGDSYYHLAVARLYAQEGPFARIPWGRMSLLGAGGDKEFLFHLALVPFTPFGTMGGRIALALFNALLATLIAVLAMQTLGWAGALVPLWLWVAAPTFFGRVMRLRPELFALAIILAALLPVRRRALWLGLLAFLFTLSYTAFHVFAALCFLWWLLRRDDWRALGYPAIGTVAGLLFRPYPMQSLRIWFVQNVEYFLNKGRLDVGTEITHPGVMDFTAASFFFAALIAMVAIGRLRKRDELVRRSAVAAAVFAILFLAMARMATYAFPLLAVVVIATCEPHVRQRAYAAVLIVCTILAVPIALRWRAVRALRAGGAPEAEWSLYGAGVPPGAKIATDWQLAEHNAWFAPQGRYLNVLDPIFMELPYPAESAASRSLFRGKEPDVPVVAATTLDSDYLAYSHVDALPDFVARTQHDPRLVLVRDHAIALLRIDRGRFGDVVFHRVTTGACQSFYNDVAPHAQPLPLEFAPYGPSTLSEKGRPILAVRENRGAFLGRGARFVLRPSAAVRRLVVETCRAANGVGGYYLIRR